MTAERSEREFFFIGNNRALDFVNTEIMGKDGAKDLLESFNDLVLWSAQAKIIEKAQAEKIEAQWGKDREGERALERARAFRAVLRETAKRISEGKPAKLSAIEAINELLLLRPGYAQLAKTREGYEKRFHMELSEPRQLLAPVAESAADLLCYGDLALVKRCENPACILYFYDATKNHARRWCSMSTCGNRMKAAAYYRRTRSE